MFCFEKSQRLLNKSDYDYVFADAKKIITPNFIVLYRQNTAGCARLGLALSKKMIAKAHDRNRIKRQIRESFRHAKLPAVDIIFLAKHGVAKVENSLIASNLNKLWPRLNTC